MTGYLFFDLMFTFYSIWTSHTLRYPDSLGWPATRIILLVCVIGGMVELERTMFGYVWLRRFATRVQKSMEFYQGRVFLFLHGGALLVSLNLAHSCRTAFARRIDLGMSGRAHVANGARGFYYRPVHVL